MKSTLALCLLTLVSGALIPIGAQANAVFSKSLGGNIPFAACTVFLIAALATVIGIVLTGAKPPEPSAFRLAPWWVYLSGFIFTFYLFTITFVAPRLGVGTAIADRDWPDHRGPGDRSLRIAPGAGVFVDRSASGRRGADGGRRVHRAATQNREN